MGGYFIILLSNGLKYATTHTRLKPPTTTQKLPKNSKLATKFCYCTLDVNTETDLGFDSDVKQWYIYMCVYIYTL